MDARMLYLHALSPIHSGSGQSTDVIDLPVVRESVTRWPYLPGSSIKGVLRDACAPESSDGRDSALFRAAFGPDTQHADEGAGALWFADGRLLCLPVRSYYGSFAWVTCPLALRRWQRDHVSSHLPLDVSLPEARLQTEAILIAEGSAIGGSRARVYLEDLDLELTISAEALVLARTIAAAVFTDATWQAAFLERFGIVSDDLFSFLAETAMEIIARVKMDPMAKTVQRHGLWYEEAVPAESIFSCPVLAQPRGGLSADDLYGILHPPLEGLLQIGGNASVGRGLVAMRLIQAQRA
jgi:CRISPR-associated protein Cmr4